MLTLTSPFYLLAVIAPFIPKVLARGSHAYEQSLPSPSPAPVVANGHPTTMASPRKPVVPVPDLRLVSETVSVSSAVSTYVSEVSRHCGVLELTISAALVDYLRFRQEHPEFPVISEKLMLETLTALGCAHWEIPDFQGHKVLQALASQKAPVSNKRLAELLGQTKGEASKSWREVSKFLTVRRDRKELRLSINSTAVKSGEFPRIVMVQIGNVPESQRAA